MADDFFNISNFRSKLTGGARPNLFEVSVTFPGLANLSTDATNVTNSFRFLCRAAAIPAFTLGIIEVPYRGRRIKVPGDRTYADWTVTVFNDENQNMRFAFDKWMKEINNPDATEAISTVGQDYRGTVDIKHLGSDGAVTRHYKLYEAFPTDVSAIDLSYDNTDTVQEFTVTFQYHYLDAGLNGAAPAASSTTTTTVAV